MQAMDDVFHIVVTLKSGCCTRGSSFATRPSSPPFPPPSYRCRLWPWWGPVIKNGPDCLSSHRNREHKVPASARIALTTRKLRRGGQVGWLTCRFSCATDHQHHKVFVIPPRGSPCSVTSEGRNLSAFREDGLTGYLRLCSGASQEGHCSWTMLESQATGPGTSIKPGDEARDTLTLLARNFVAH